VLKVEAEGRNVLKATVGNVLKAREAGVLTPQTRLCSVAKRVAAAREFTPSLW
jgi:hypothetical protein